MRNGTNTQKNLEVITIFLGEYNHNIDTKQRVIVPAKFREGLGESFVITKGYDECIFIYDMTEWQTLVDKVKTLPKGDPSVRKFERFFIGGASMLELDSQGRVVLPKILKDYAKIEKSVVFLGVSNRIELWSKEIWDKYNVEENFVDDTLAEKMALLGI